MGWYFAWFGFPHVARKWYGSYFFAEGSSHDEALKTMRGMAKKVGLSNLEAEKVTGEFVSREQAVITAKIDHKSGVN